MTSNLASDSDDQTRPALVFFLDVDNTLFNNDQFKLDLERKLQHLLGEDRAERFWTLYESVRVEQSFVDYPLTIERFAAESDDGELRNTLTTLLEGMQFSSYVYPGALDAITYLHTLGEPVILSDGDSVFQPYKIQYSGLERAVRDKVVITIHKEQELDSVFQRYPASHYVVVDDKPSILAALEECCPTTITTVFVMQGKYAVAGKYFPAPDLTVDRIAALQGISRDEFLAGSRSPVEHTEGPGEAAP